jgi:hypothetical protein
MNCTVQAWLSVVSTVNSNSWQRRRQTLELSLLPLPLKACERIVNKIMQALVCAYTCVSSSVAADLVNFGQLC